jgi:hypothetical protein
MASQVAFMPRLSRQTKAFGGFLCPIRQPESLNAPVLESKAQHPVADGLSVGLMISNPHAQRAELTDAASFCFPSISDPDLPPTSGRNVLIDIGSVDLGS